MSFISINSHTPHGSVLVSSGGVCRRVSARTWFQPMGCNWLRLHGETICCGGQIILLFGDCRQDRAAFGGKEKRVCWFLISGSPMLRLAGRHGGGDVAASEEDFAKSFRENGKALMVLKGWNKSGHFLVAAVFAEGGQRGSICFLEGREGWGW
jgi:hypothetical protein